MMDDFMRGPLQLTKNLVWKRLLLRCRVRLINIGGLVEMRHSAESIA
jgi:hypothetical protein